MAQYKTILYDSTRWDGFSFRAGDIVISTPPKAGTTWTQRICALLIFQTPQLDKPLGTLSPWLDMLTRPLADVLSDLEQQTHRRFIKSHTPMDGLPLDERVTYVCVARDPRDVALSWDNHFANANFATIFGLRETAVGNDDIAEFIEQGPPPRAETERERFWDWVHDDAPPTEKLSLKGVLHHLSSFWAARHRPNVVLLHYDDLKSDLEGQMRALAGRLGIEVPEESWPALVKAATFEEMRRAANDVAPGAAEKIWHDNTRFFNRGTSGQWRTLFGDGDHARYDARVREMVDPELAAWVHHAAAAR